MQQGLRSAGRLSSVFTDVIENGPYIHIHVYFINERMSIEFT